jgi:predicted nucleic acid-binding protein
MELGAGEREAIQLGLQLGIGLLLMDEREGTLLAKHQGFEVLGTLGVLLELAQLSLVSLDEALERLGQTNFRRTAELFDRVRTLARQRGLP